MPTSHRKCCSFAENVSLIPRSVLLQAIGFACREEPEGTRIGPFLKGENTTEDDVKQMDKYMIRTWVETSLYLRAFQKRNGESENLSFWS